MQTHTHTQLHYEWSNSLSPLLCHPEWRNGSLVDTVWVRMRASLLRVRASTQTFLIHTFTYTNSTHANFFQFYLLSHQNGFNKYKKKKKNQEHQHSRYQKQTSWRAVTWRVWPIKTTSAHKKTGTRTGAPQLNRGTKADAVVPPSNDIDVCEI